jgi:hypothetical protein
MIRYKGYAMSSYVLSSSSNTVDRREPRAMFADGGSVPIWIVPHP